MKFTFEPAYKLDPEEKYYQLFRRDRRSMTNEVLTSDTITITDGFSTESENSSISEISNSFTVGYSKSIDSGLFSNSGNISYTRS